ncbi:DNA repair protein rad52 [Ascosphaera atra]|nr:DNA repair protein rad52 [Ascosphaera atra]
MPSYGDHYGSNMSAGYGNPFAPIEQRINPWTAQEIVALQRRLSTRLGPEYLSTRPGPGGQKVCYLTGPTVINLANEVFGFNGWSSAIQNVVVDEVTQNPNTGKFSVCVSVVVRCSADQYKDLGYGHCENMKEKFQALEKAKKEGVTDGLKRAMRTFGNVLGNGLYEKDYQDALKRTKTNRVKLDGNTFKQPEDLPAPPPPDQTVVEGEDIMDLEEDFGSDLFEEAADLGEPIMALDPTEDTTDAARLQAQPPQRTDQPQFQTANPINNPNQFITPSKPPNRSWQPGRAAVPSRLQPGQHAAPSRTAGQLQQQQQQQAQAQQRQRQQRPQLAESRGAPQAPPQAPTDPNLTDLPPPLPGAKAEDADQTPVIPPEIPEDKRPPDPAGGFYSAKAADYLRFCSVERKRKLVWTNRIKAA